MMQASLVIPSWRRRANLPAIIERALEHSFFAEVIIWDNLAEVGLLGSLPDDRRVSILGDGANHCTWGRFLCAMVAQSDLILTCDDDVLIEDWEPVYRAALLAEPRQIVCGMSGGHWRDSARHCWEQDGRTCHEVLLGWGAGFRRSWIDKAFRPYIERYGEDDLLRRKADRLFSMLLGRKHRTWQANYQDLPGANEQATALWLRKDHQKLTWQARVRATRLLGIEDAALSERARLSGVLEPAGGDHGERATSDA